MLLLEGVEVHVRDDAFKSCLRRHMDWLDELVIDADDNTWFRWMSRRQTKGQRHGQIQMSGDGSETPDANQPKTRQKRQFEVQSGTTPVELAPLGGEFKISLLSGIDLKPSVTDVSQQQLNESENVVSSTATAPVSSASAETVNFSVLDSNGCEILLSAESKSTLESIKNAEDESNDSTIPDDSNVDEASTNQDLYRTAE
ncbi:uncharacterized protein LOC141909545 [Tubulanus polymorphus]|uniref:uncharacterized protein LOC141909545 n=1 Tax=Tubulanus polymorphus TaxID=672921 RepID=UPI003DA30DA3